MVLLSLGISAFFSYIAAFVSVQLIRVIHLMVISTAIDNLICYMILLGCILGE